MGKVLIWFVIIISTVVLYCLMKVKAESDELYEELMRKHFYGRQLNGEVDESEIQNIMRYGRSDIDDEYFAIIKAEIEDFVDKVYNSIREFGYNLKTTPIVFVGGGAVVMKNFGSHDAKNISYNLDVKANARGYEQLATMGLKSARRIP